MFDGHDVMLLVEKRCTVAFLNIRLTLIWASKQVFYHYQNFVNFNISYRRVKQFAVVHILLSLAIFNKLSNYLVCFILKYVFKKILSIAHNIILIKYKAT